MNHLFEIKDNRLVKYLGNETSVCIDEGVEALQTSAFEECDGIEKLTIPASVVKIEKDPCGFYFDIFRGCPHLKEIVIDENNPVYASTPNHDGVVLKEDGTLLYGCAAAEYNPELVEMSRLDPVGVMNLFLFGVHAKWEEDWCCEYLEYGAAKDWERAMNYIPAHVAAVWEEWDNSDEKFLGITTAANHPDVVLRTMTDKMRRVGYTAQDIDAFRNAWVAEGSKHTAE